MESASSSRGAPKELALASTPGGANAAVYGRGPRTLAFSARKRCALALSASVALSAMSALLSLCLFRGFCHADAIGARTTYSAAVSNGVVPASLVLALAIAPSGAAAASLARPALSFGAAGAAAVAATLLLVAGVGELALLPSAGERATNVWCVVRQVRDAGPRGDEDC